jgi:hypothetical protein
MAQSFSDKHKLNKAVRLINKKDTVKSAQLISNLYDGDRWRNQEKLKLLYVTNSIYDLPTKGEVMKLSKDSIRIAIKVCNTFLSKWIELGPDTISLEKKGIKAEKIYDERIALIYMLNSLCKDSIYEDSISNLIVIIDYRNSIDRDSFAQAVADIMKRQGTDLVEGDYEIKAVAAGVDGNDLSLQLVIGSENRSGYPPSKYQSNSIESRIRIFATMMWPYIEDTTFKHSDTIIGSADADPPGAIPYLGEFGPVSFHNQILDSGSIITNEQLAYLRGYNAKVIFDSITESNLDINCIYPVDYQQDPRKPVGPQYRGVIMIIYIVDYFQPKYDKIPDKVKARAYINRSPIIWIKNGKIIR